MNSITEDRTIDYLRYETYRAMMEAVDSEGHVDIGKLTSALMDLFVVRFTEPSVEVEIDGDRLNVTVTCEAPAIISLRFSL